MSRLILVVELCNAALRDIRKFSLAISGDRSHIGGLPDRKRAQRLGGRAVRFNTRQRGEELLETLDDILRFSAFGLLLWLTLLVVRDFRDRLSGRIGALASATAAAYLMSTKPGLALAGVDIDLVLLPAHTAALAFAWLFCLSQFNDNFEVAGWHKLVVFGKMTSGAGGYLAWKYGYPLVLQGFIAVTFILVVGVIAHLIYVAWRGRNDDLLEARREFRSIFVSGVIVISIGVMIAEIWLIGRGIRDILLVAQSGSFLAITLFLLWRISAPGGIDLFANKPALTEEPAVAGEHCELTVADKHDLEVIKSLSGSEVILEPGLTIAKFASHTAIPEHRLRHLINQHMGYRNFSDYLNHHRVEAAKNRLAKSDERHTPVLTVAMDLGYGSLGPFNRAFKERTGLTPTEYRSRSLELGVAAAK